MLVQTRGGEERLCRTYMCEHIRRREHIYAYMFLLMPGHPHLFNHVILYGIKPHNPIHVSKLCSLFNCLEGLIKYKNFEMANGRRQWNYRYVMK